MNHLKCEPEKTVFKFSVYDSETSRQKRTTYRIYNCDKGLVIQKFHKPPVWWMDVYKNVYFENLTGVMKSTYFKRLFTK